MKFHAAVHGCNVIIEDGGYRALRTSSFCDGITFSNKPLSTNSRISVVLTANEDWTGALRIGLTTQDPATLANKKLPRYVCPDLTAKPGYWARPLPEAWAANGNRLTFYVNGKGQLHAFINNDHKGAILTNLPIKEQLWIILDLYGITTSVKFLSNSGSAPTEVIARGPEAVQAYKDALSYGSIPYCHTRIALIGPEDRKKTFLKKLLVKSGETDGIEYDGIDTTCMCQTSENNAVEPWDTLKRKSTDDGQTYKKDIVGDDAENSERESSSNPVYTPEEEYFRAIAVNIVREILLQRKKSKEDRKKTSGVRSTFSLQSSFSKIVVPKSISKAEDSTNVKESMISNGSEELPDDLPARVVELVETMLKESECKLMLEKKENEKKSVENAVMTFNIWNFNGHVKCLFFHQIFLSPQTIYIFVFDLSQDLDVVVQDIQNYGIEFPLDTNLTYLSLLHIWLEMIYLSMSYPKEEYKSDNVVNDIICPLFPPVLIVGVQEDTTSSDPKVEHQFNKIKESIQDKVYYHLVHPVFYFIGNYGSSEVDNMIIELRVKIQELALQMPHFSTEIPLKWILFEKAIDRLVEREVYFADINKLSEVARLENIESDEEFYSMVHFYHRQGKILHLGSERLKDNDESCGIVILKPQWLIDHIYQLMSTSACTLLKQESMNKNEVRNSGVTHRHFQKIWPNAFHHIGVFLDVLNDSDVICELPNEISDEEDDDLCPTKFRIPWLTDVKAQEIITSKQKSIILILDFSNMLPVGFFTKLMVRLLRWSSQHDWKKSLIFLRKNDEILVDYNHVIWLQKIHGNRIHVTIMQRKYFESEEGVKNSYPLPHICSKVRHLLERETDHLRDTWYKRLSYSINIPCPCSKLCKLHDVQKCPHFQCLHLLSLNECLSKKVIVCEYRLIKTDFIQKYFLSNPIEDYISAPIVENYFWNEGDLSRDESAWITNVGKMLTRTHTGKDWIALAKLLGFSEREIQKLSHETFPSISLLNNWIDSNGRTRYCIDLLIACLEQMERQDAASCIMKEIGPELPSPPVFMSYQWESQECVLNLRRRIELAGFPCWMDVGHIQGGEALYGKIYEGINRAKVILCCLSPRYVMSPLCTREMSLADVLRKPIVPIMLEPTPWPPPGALALILSSLVYIDLCGIGSHGGYGKQSDWETHFSGIIERLSHFVSPSFLFPGSLTNAPPSLQHEPVMQPSYVIPEDPEEYLESLGLQEYRENEELPLTEEEEEEEEESASENASVEQEPQPAAWVESRRNRVVRCSVCILL